LKLKYFAQSPNSETLKQSIGEGTKNWRINGLTLPYLMTTGERKSELLEEVIPASWCLVEEVREPRCLVSGDSRLVERRGVSKSVKKKRWRK